MRKTGLPIFKILDLGTGTGCIIISLFLELNKKINVTGDGVDISDDALEIAKKNARYHNLETKLIFLKVIGFQM